MGRDGGDILITSGVAGRRTEMEVDSLNWDDIAKFRDKPFPHETLGIADLS